MPPRKKGRTTNKKKRRSVPSSESIAARTAGSASSTSRAPILDGETPDFSDYEQRTTPQAENYKTFYIRYKEATNRFYDFMMDQTPEDVRGKPCVNALVSAADWMKEQQSALPKSVLKDLKLAIRMRDRVAKSVFGGGDEGHQHFLEVLIYCWTVLIDLPRIESARQKLEEEFEAEAGEANRYAVLEEDVDDDGDDNSEFLPSSPVTRPEPQPEPMTLQELHDADDLYDAILFLLALNDLMGYVAGQYKAVLHAYRRDNDASETQRSALVGTMLKAAVATNMAVQQVKTLEMALQEQHQHLSTPFRVLSTLDLSKTTQTVTGIVKDHSAKKCLPTEIIAFVGDCTECFFRPEWDTLSRNDTLVEKFCADYELDVDGRTQLEEAIRTLHYFVVLEVPVGAEEKEFIARMHQRTGTSTHSWLKNMKFIGGDRPIHHTIRLLQWFGYSVHTSTERLRAVPLGGFFGPPWQPGQSRTTHGDLDELLLSDIISQWVLMCRNGIIGQARLPFENELYPVFVSLRNYVQAPFKPVSWSLAFAMHAMLTAILETDAIFDELKVIQRSAFMNYFDGVRSVLEVAKSENDFCSNKTFNKNMCVLSFLQRLCNEELDGRALWNPLCGGTMLSYVAYLGNLRMGCNLVDCHMQLRITLHLFNAFLVNGFIKPGQVPFLDTLHSVFESSRAVWEGPLPERGQLVQRFWICFGMNPQDTKRMAEAIRREFRAGRAVSELLTLSLDYMRQRKVNRIVPEKLSTSFRRICNQDFRDVQDKLRTAEQCRRNKGTDMSLFYVLANDTLDAIEGEQQLLSLHLPFCGAILEQFICKLSGILRWDPLLSNMAASSLARNDKRLAFLEPFTEHLLVPLDFADDPRDYMLSQTSTVQASIDFMTTFFGQLDREKADWFHAAVQTQA